MRHRPRLMVGLVSAAAATTLGATLGVAHPGVATAAPPACMLSGPSGPVSHVISLVFDNVHFTRDNPNVPSDLEQMPHLLSFLEQNGAVLSNEHTPLIAHTADDILTTLTGVYGDKHGQPVANSYRTYNTNGTTTSASSFAYWTDPVASRSTDQTPTMDDGGKIAPAPWVPYTRAGCDVGAFSTANLEVENSNPDLRSIYGARSPQWAEVKNEITRYGYPDISDANYQGVAVHCARTSSSVCTRNPSLAAPDRLPDEPGGYTNYQALYGNTNVGPVIGGRTTAGTRGVCVNDLNGQPMTSYYAGVDVGGTYCGFPGFDVSPSQTLAYVAGMQEAGIPVTYGYMEDAHADHVTGSGAYGPGQVAYVAQLKSFDDAFATFFARLQKDGITTKNTLFEVSSDEGDHFAGSQNPTPPGCDGVTVACTYGPNQIGEVTLNVNGQLHAQYGTNAVRSSAYQIHADTAPNFWLTGNPQPGDPTARALEQQMAGLQAFDQHANNDAGATVNVTNYLADQVEESILHFDTADPSRLPTFTDFAKPDFYILEGGSTCSTSSPCDVVSSAYAWNHGDVAPDINTNWVAFAGRGVTGRGVDSTTWADETDVRPTLMALLGLTDDYASDGRVLFTDVNAAVLPSSFSDSKRYEALLGLESAYKQLNADVGTFGLATLVASTTALSSTSGTTYTTIENELSQLDSQRDALAAHIETLLNGIEFRHQSASAAQMDSLTSQANQLIADAQAL